MVVAAWLLATIIGGPIGLAINAIIIAYGLYELWPLVKDVAGELWLWLKSAYYAESESALAQAGGYFVDALAKGGLAALEAVVTHRAFKFGGAKLRQRWPTPDWLSERFTEVERERGIRQAEESRKRRGRVIDAASERLGGAASALVVPAGKGVGEFPVGFAVVSGVVVALGMGATILWASTSEKRT
jgi:hypothetical protein